jgi:hypothetical protein
MQLPNFFRRILGQKTIGEGNNTAGLNVSGWRDRFRARREPTTAELINQLKNAAYSCASLNASVCAKQEPRLYVITRANDTPPKCRTQKVSNTKLKLLWMQPSTATIEEVVEHPLLDLLRNVNPYLNGYDLLELTTLYQEVTGHAFWYLQRNGFGLPTSIWPLASHCVNPIRHRGSDRPIDGYQITSSAGTSFFEPEEIIHFRYPDPRDPYLGGLAPLRACWEHVSNDSDYLAMKGSLFSNSAMPSAIVTPKDALGEAERARLEADWNNKFRHATRHHCNLRWLYKLRW